MARYAPGNYPEHAVVLGWSISAEKDAHMMRMTHLASAAHGQLAPAAPPSPP